MVLWRRIPVWPLQLILTCLLAVSLDAARIWGAELPVVARLRTPGDPGLPGDSEATDEVSYPDTGRSANPATPPTSKRLTQRTRAEDYWHEPETLIENLDGLAAPGGWASGRRTSCGKFAPWDPRCSPARRPRPQSSNGSWDWKAKCPNWLREFR